MATASPPSTRRTRSSTTKQYQEKETTVSDLLDALFADALAGNERQKTTSDRLEELLRSYDLGTKSSEPVEEVKVDDDDNDNGKDEQEDKEEYVLPPLGVTLEEQHRSLPKNLLARITNNSNFCVMQNSGNKKRCSKGVTIEVDKTKKLVEKLSRLELPDQWDEAAKILRDLITGLLCRYPHGRKASGNFDWLVGKIDSRNDESVRRKGQKVIDQGEHWETLTEWINQICSEDGEVPETPEVKSRPKAAPRWDSGYSDGYTAPSTRSTQRGPASQTPYTQNMKPYRPQARSNRTIGQEISYWLLKDLSKSDLNPQKTAGFIYMYQLSGNKPYIKIGYTTQTVEKRMNTWKKCGGSPEGLDFVEDDGEPLRKVKTIRRLENLIHAELVECRVVQMNCNCGKEHKEWFKIPEAHARLVWKKWIDFLRTDPYDPETGELLVDKNSEEFRYLCQPVRFTR